MVRNVTPMYVAMLTEINLLNSFEQCHGAKLTVGPMAICSFIVGLYWNLKVLTV